MRAVGRELHVRDARLRRHLHGGLGAVGNLLQRDRIDPGAGQAGRAVRTVRLRVHARAGEPVHRLRELRDRRVGPRLRERHDLFVRAEQRLRQRLGIEGVDDRLGRQHVLRCIGGRRHLRDHPRSAVKDDRRENDGGQDEGVQR